MFIPLYDGVRIRRIRAPVVTYAILASCIGLWLASTAGLLPAVEPLLAAGFGVIPQVVTGAAYLPPSIVQAPSWATPVTSLFLHGGAMHLIGNMLFLWVFADNVEDSMGHVRFILFYLLCGVAAGLLHTWVNIDSTRPLIGASGAISGVIAAYLLLHPRVRIWGLVLKYIPLQAPAWLAIGAWILFQLGQGFFGDQNTVAWFAHIGGVAAGLALTPLLLAPGVGLKDCWNRTD
jgi:membrane associated rhomboid family serine protease